MSVFCVVKAGKVRYIRNITDIDDKIIKRANENGGNNPTAHHAFHRCHE
ncbi:hypothetical protein ABVN80_17840 [Acinetobacter baumannii]